jgi:hypothetical protein
MKSRTTIRLLACSLMTGAVLLGSLAAVPAAAQTPPTAIPPYKISVFANSPMGISQPDSIVQWHDSIIIGFQNHVAKDGTDGKSSTIVEFSLSGKVKGMFTVPGHNDGLRIVGDDDLWALQNEDANPNLVVIELRSGKAKQYKFAPTPHGGGYDDMVVKDGKVFITASNPNVDAMGNNVFPALVRASLSGSNVLLETVFNGNGSATDIPTGTSVTLNLTDPDSMTIDPRGNIVVDSQADSELIFVRNPLTDEQTLGRLNISQTALLGTDGKPLAITLDDTAFAPHSRAILLVTDVNGGVIYRIDAGTFGFEPGTAYTASDTLGLVGSLNLDNGVVTPIVTGFGSARGLLFVSPDVEHGGDER